MNLILKILNLIKDYCDFKKIIFFSTPFDKESVWFLQSLDVKLFKISSFDISNYQLINEVAKTKKPTILSTGMASIKEINKAYNYFKKKKQKLHYCTASHHIPTKKKLHIYLI